MMLDGGGIDPIRLDFGTRDSAVASGWVGFGSTEYDSDRGYGWEGARLPYAGDFGRVIDDPLLADFHYGFDHSFRVDLPSGRYDVTAVASGFPHFRPDMNVWAEGELAASGDDDELSFRVDVTDGHLDLRFAGGDRSIYLLAGLEIEAAPGLTASAGGPYEAIEGMPITLDASASGGTGDFTFAWDLDGDGTFDDAFGREVDHTFPDDGEDVVMVFVTDSSGQAASAMAQVSVSNADPTATINASGSAVAGRPAAFEASVSDPSPLDEAAGFTYAWDFGDGATSTEASPDHVYSEPGRYNVTLRATDKDGGSGTASATVTVEANGLMASAGGPYTGTEGMPVTLHGSASGGAVQPLAFAWDLDGDGTYESAGPDITHAFDDNGDYPVALRVIDGEGWRAFDSTTVTVSNAAPTASAGGPYTADVDQAITFRGTASDPGPLDEAAGFTYAWDFGDGSASDKATPSHAYSAGGTYTVTLTVTDKDGASATVSATASIAGEREQGNPIQTHHETIPDFGANPTIVSASSGPWSDPNTWAEGRTPRVGDVVALMSGHAVSYDVASDAELKAVSIHADAALDFRTDIDTRLLVGTLLVRPDGSLIVGDEAGPVRSDVTAQIVIADQSIDTAFDPSQHGTGLIGLGEVTMHGTPMSSTFMRLAAEPEAGDTTLTLEQPVDGWRVGDQLYLPDSRQLMWNERDNNYVSESEYPILAGVSADGTVLTLSEPLQFDHPGARDGDGVLEFLPHVANRSRNVVIESEDPGGTRGHVMFHGRADVDVRYAAFRDLGRTRNERLDSTTFDEDGDVTHIGTNQIGRYPLHAHHLIGPAQTPDNGYQFALIGNAVDGGRDVHNLKWGLTVHGSHYGLIRDNVVHNIAGAGVVAEDGSESRNIFERNFAAEISGTGTRIDVDGNAGTAFWFRGPDNYVRDNVATNIRGGVYSYGFNVFARYLGQAKVPAFQGANPMMPGQSSTVDMNATPLREFARNEVYGATRNGLTLWWIGTFGGTPRPDVGESIVEDFSVWNHYSWGYFAYPSNHMTFDGFTVRGDPGRLREAGRPVGMTFGDYYQKDLTIRNADIVGMKAGIVPSAITEGDQIIENSYLKNETNIIITTQFTNSYRSDRIPPRRVIIRNVRFDHAGLPNQPIDIRMHYTVSGFGSRNLIQDDEVFVQDYNGDPGDDFRVYYEEQASDFVVPQSIYNEDGTTRLTASPEAGLTNQENWDRYGIAVAGAVAPTTQRRDGIDGFVDPT